MSGDMSRQSGSNGQLPDNVPEQEEDEFGEFEGFEGVPEEPLQAQAVPSPWATFPDLLPVQTSSTAAAEESAQNPPCRSSENRGAEAWPDAVVAPVHRVPEEGTVGGASAIFLPPVRSTNPPDVSLGACSSSANLDPAPDTSAVGAEPVLAASPESRAEPSAASWQHQYLQVNEQRENLQQQVLLLQQDNQILQQQLVNCHAQIQSLQLQLAQQQASEHAESRRMDEHLATVCQKLDNLQASVSDLHESQSMYVHKRIFENSFENLKADVESKVSEISRHNQEQTSDLEDRLMNKFSEEMQTHQTSLENIFQQHIRTLSDRISNSPPVASASNHPNQTDQALDSVLSSVRNELRRHTQEQERLMERERRQQFIALSQVLKAACASLGSLVDNDSAEHNNVNDSQKS